MKKEQNFTHIFYGIGKNLVVLMPNPAHIMLKLNPASVYDAGFRI